MLLAEELTLLAIDPATGRHAMGERSILNACLAGLLVAELVIDGHVVPGRRRATFDRAAPRPLAPPALAAAAEIVEEKGPKVRSVLSHMSRGLEQRIGTGTWDTTVAGLVAVGAVSTPQGSLRPSVEVLDPAARHRIVERLRSAATGDGPIDDRTAVLLNATGPARLLEVVAPDRKGRRHVRRRIDSYLDGTPLGEIGASVRKLIAEASQSANTSSNTAAYS